MESEDDGGRCPEPAPQCLAACQDGGPRSQHRRQHQPARSRHERKLGIEQHDILQPAEFSGDGSGDPAKDCPHPRPHPLLHHHHHRLHWEPACRRSRCPQQEHDEHNQPVDTESGGKERRQAM